MSGKLNSCHNRKPFKPWLIVQDGWFMDGVSRTPRMTTTPFRMTPGCVYGNDTSEDAKRGGLGAFDVGCAGCCWHKGAAA